MATAPQLFTDFDNTTAIIPKLAPVDAGFTILIDSNEGQPWSFEGIHGDHATNFAPYAVRTRWESLGTAMGDYTIDGFRGTISIERKSVDDALGTILGWGERRARFERELANLQSMQFAAVIVEGTMLDCLNACQQWGKKTREENQRAFASSVRAYRHNFPRVQWEFCDSRRMAEVSAFKHLQRFWEMKVMRLRRVRREMKRNRKVYGGLF